MTGERWNAVAYGCPGCFGRFYVEPPVPPKVCPYCAQTIELDAAHIEADRLLADRSSG